MTAPTVLDKFAAAYLRVYQSLHSDAAEAQWMPGRTPVLREDTTERSKGLTSDPVPTTAMDGRRLNLRAAVMEAEKALSAADQALRLAESKLRRAFAQVESEPSESEPLGN